MHGCERVKARGPATTTLPFFRQCSVLTVPRIRTPRVRVVVVRLVLALQTALSIVAEDVVPASHVEPLHYPGSSISVVRCRVSGLRFPE